mmetsp:Transcript_4712/g.10222  ORF Transcript_4712/g.10222 Transcript_4712/m.10222 type:complete len:537 (-) Transcript_4712:1244-2854(-)
MFFRYLSFVFVSLAFVLASVDGEGSIPDDASGNRKVVHVVIDGLTARTLDSLLAANDLPNLAFIKEQGAFTDNARIDFDSSQTLPSHVSMFTGLTVEEHGNKEDKDPGNSRAINGLENIFDLVNDANMRSCFFGSKDKFEFFERSSWAIDHYDYNKNGEDTVSAFKTQMDAKVPCVYSFVHFREPDKAGHSDGPDDKEYVQAVKKADGFVGQVRSILESRNMMADTAIIVVTDHGFEIDGNHSDRTDENVYTVPFFVMGPHVKAGANLYELNQGRYADPGNTRPSNNAAKQPIRTQLSGVLAADFLGIGSNNGPLATSNQLLKVGSGDLVSFPTMAPTTVALSTDAPTVMPTMPTAPPTEATATPTTSVPTMSPQTTPAVQSFEAIAMTYISERRKAKAFGRRRMMLNLQRRFRKSKQGLLQFDLSSGRIEEMTKIEIALTCTKSSSSGGISFFKTLESNWNQKTVTWKTAPGRDTNIGSLPVPKVLAGETYTTTLVGGKDIVDSNGLVSLRVSTRSRIGSKFVDGKLIVTYGEKS